jgi:hypothetical protein
MAIVSPALVSFETGQDCTVTVTLSPAEDASAWTVSAILRSYNGGPIVATGNVSGATLTTTPVWTITWTAAQLTLAPGGYVWEFTRTNAGFVYPIVEPSAFIIRASSGSAYPMLTNLSEYIVHARVSVTPTTAAANQIIQLLSSSEEQVKQFCGRDFAYRALVTEYYDSNGQRRFRLNRRPVVPTSVVIYEDYGGNYGQTTNSFDPTNSILTLGTDYSVPIDSKWADGLSYGGWVERINSVWPYARQRPIDYLGIQQATSRGSIKATYSGGYQLIPYPIKEAIWNLTTLKARLSIYGQLFQSQSGEGYSYSMGPYKGGIPEEIKAILNLYADAGCFVG